MPTVQSTYLGELRTQATHVASGNAIITDAPTDNNGKGEAFSPTDLVCAALGSCMITIMGITANRLNIDLKGLDLAITKHMHPAPRKISQIDVLLTFPPLQLDDKTRDILRNAALTCPVALSLHPDIKQNIEFRF